MPTTWTINAAGSDANGTELIGCHITTSGNCYQFLAPDNTLMSSACGTTSLPTLPCQFPMFSSKLGGNTVVNWYITLDSVTDGTSHNKAKGKWGNSGYKSLTDVEADGWTTAAGVGIDPEEEKASYAAPKP